MKQTQKAKLLAEMERVVPWVKLLAIVQPFYYSSSGRGHLPYPLQTMLRIYMLQTWFGYSDPEDMEDALNENLRILAFCGLSLETDNIPDAAAIAKFRQLIRTHKLTGRILGEFNAHLMQEGIALQPAKIVSPSIVPLPNSDSSASKHKP